ncbi:uncharacterized protein BXZ73DRAFT_49381 [Epithele typhae]|uniref:uncharacterized protein n=1 Tax=Epithele typhae TaxID=378194 RepID=UPI002007D118|nr:uncharacterized protein BXZ73DRAFT_49381 [Epithele typhae]KAH9926629.1 hypothetical protein BXZ73DRAFT_49381 [Epithele typhae]
MSRSSSASCSPVPSPKQATQTILAGRKCYRISKDKNEVVWPPHLEAALMEGLDKYTPAESKSPRGLTRFPNRNKFISQYILEKTGETRTAKQVGSRIQQLRDTSAGKTIMKAISDRHYEMMHPTRPPPQTDGAGAVGIAHVFISVPPPSVAGSPVPPAQPFAGPSRHTGVTVLPNGRCQWVEPRALRSINPTVTFLSASTIPLFSTCTVESSFDGVVHEGDAMLMEELGVVPDGCAYLHYTTLAPAYWDTLCLCHDLAPYTIFQEISRLDDATQRLVPVKRILYHFTSGAAPPLSPFSFSDPDLEMVSSLPPPAMFHAPSSSDGSFQSDRSSSPSYSVAAGFASAPLSPVDQWSMHAVSGAQDQWAFGGLPAAPAAPAPSFSPAFPAQPFVQAAGSPPMPFSAGAYAPAHAHSHSSGGRFMFC